MKCDLSLVTSHAAGTNASLGWISGNNKDKRNGEE